MRNSKKLYIFTLFSLFSLCLNSCSNGSVSEKSYIKELDLFKDKEEIRILQITDVHWNFGTDFIKEKAYISALVKNTQPDLIVSTGDIVLQGNKITWEHALDTLDSFNIPYFLTYGNHEYQGMYRPTYPYFLMKNRKNCLNKHVDDNIDGESNFVINLTDGVNTKYQLYSLDSKNLYRQWDIKISYDVINESQINWYKKQISYANPDLFDGLYNFTKDEEPIPSLVFTHIPLWQIEYAYRLCNGVNNVLLGQINRYSGYEYEDVYSNAPSELSGTRAWVGYRDSGAFKAFEDMRSTKAVYFGHDHSNDFAAEYRTQATTSKGKDVPYITLAYGLKTGAGLTSHDKMMGGNLIKIKSSGDLQNFRAFQDYVDDYSGGNGFHLEDMFK